MREFHSLWLVFCILWGVHKYTYDLYESRSTWRTWHIRKYQYALCISWWFRWHVSNVLRGVTPNPAHVLGVLFDAESRGRIVWCDMCVQALLNSLWILYSSINACNEHVDFGLVYGIYVFLYALSRGPFIFCDMWAEPLLNSLWTIYRWINACRGYSLVG